MPGQKVKIKHRFITKLMISHILLVAIPVVLAGAILISTAQKSFKQSYKNRTVELARHSSIEINMALENGEKILRLGASEIYNIATKKIKQELVINQIVLNKKNT